MRRALMLCSLMLAFATVAAPDVSWARAAGGFSMGSRGTRSFATPPATRTAPSYAAPLQRSLTPQPAPSFSPAPGYGGGGFGRRSAFGSGLMGGLIGAGIGGMLFGGGMFGGLSGGASFLGLLLQLFLLLMLGRFLWRLFVSRQPAVAGGGMFSRNPAAAAPRMMATGSTPAAKPLAAKPLQVTQADFQAFEQLLRAVQAAWSAHDLATLRGIASPEMTSYFAEQLSEQTSRGVRNTVSDIRLEQGDLSEAWAEPGREYATVAMRFSMLDVTRDGGGHVVDGSPTERVTATEVWTFLRAAGGRWILSAIQQVR